jgi:hypothetical protein
MHGYRRLASPTVMLYYNNIGALALSAGNFMTHHHDGGEPHPSPTISPSLLRLSAPWRLTLAGGLIALIWAAFLWATR